MLAGLADSLYLSVHLHDCHVPRPAEPVLRADLNERVLERDFFRRYRHWLVAQTLDRVRLSFDAERAGQSLYLHTLWLFVAPVTLDLRLSCYNVAL